MAVRNPTSEKKASLKNLLGSSEVLWTELFDELDNLKALHTRAKQAKGTEREELEVALYIALSHIQVHTKALLETADESD